ncbi:MAG TPA: hypothetical protein DDZ55_03055 [Firmicutes bacterium]|nr:hypothetical protein [Bacillota bacterium]
MKKNSAFMLSLIIGILLAFVFSRSSLSPTKEEKVMAGFNDLIAQEEIAVGEVIAYVDTYVGEVSRENAAKLALGLEQVQKDQLSAWQRLYEDSALQEEMAAVYQRHWSLDDLKQAEDETTRQIVAKTVASGYKVETAEGTFFPVIDYTFYQKYYEVMTADVRAYFTLMAVESEATPVKDAALMISWEEILRRAEAQEKFIEEYNTSTQVEPVRQLMERYITFTLFGCNNTPLFSYDTKEMDPEAKEAFAAYIAKGSTGEFSALIKDYFEVLEKNDFRLTAEVEAYRKQ